MLLWRVISFPPWEHNQTCILTQTAMQQMLSPQGQHQRFNCAVLFLKTLKWLLRMNFKPLSYGLVWNWLISSTRLDSCHIKGRAMELSNPFSPFTKPGFQDKCLAEEVKNFSLWPQNSSTTLCPRECLLFPSLR